MMAARAGRPLLLIDLAVPRDIDPACRECPGSASTTWTTCRRWRSETPSGREAEAAGAESVLRGELARFERWLAR